MDLHQTLIRKRTAPAGFLAIAAAAAGVAFKPPHGPHDPTAVPTKTSGGDDDGCDGGSASIRRTSLSAHCTSSVSRTITPSTTEVTSNEGLTNGRRHHPSPHSWGQALATAALPHNVPHSLRSLKVRAFSDVALSRMDEDEMRSQPLQRAGVSAEPHPGPGSSSETSRLPAATSAFSSAIALDDASATPRLVVPAAPPTTATTTGAVAAAPVVFFMAAFEGVMAADAEPAT
ncbi:hypothetical protein Vretifemale_6229 [Volvox reticuliferus]|uniref:Uncharacterized protein n=1 Tax=Volvox reticuliferus TaxID=1737510 RepID=A0A8J4FL56_9CHLO|nr:hypothetical protein Vretifemale_6229 [Volvox reticuliferus]